MVDGCVRMKMDVVRPRVWNGTSIPFVPPSKTRGGISLHGKSSLASRVASTHGEFRYFIPMVSSLSVVRSNSFSYSSPLAPVVLVPADLDSQSGRSFHEVSPMNCQGSAIDRHNHVNSATDQFSGFDDPAYFSIGQLFPGPGNKEESFQDIQRVSSVYNFSKTRDTDDSGKEGSCFSSYVNQLPPADLVFPPSDWCIPIDGGDGNDRGDAFARSGGHSQKELDVPAVDEHEMKRFGLDGAGELLLKSMKMDADGPSTGSGRTGQVESSRASELTSRADSSTLIQHSSYPNGSLLQSGESSSGTMVSCPSSTYGFPQTNRFGSPSSMASVPFQYNSSMLQAMLVDQRLLSYYRQEVAIRLNSKLEATLTSSSGPAHWSLPPKDDGNGNKTHPKAGVLNAPHQLCSPPPASQVNRISSNAPVFEFGDISKPDATNKTTAGSNLDQTGCCPLHASITSFAPPRQDSAVIQHPQLINWRPSIDSNSFERQYSGRPRFFSSLPRAPPPEYRSLLRPLANSDYESPWRPLPNYNCQLQADGGPTILTLKSIFPPQGDYDQLPAPGPGPQRPRRTRITQNSRAMTVLTDWFDRNSLNPYPNVETKRQLANAAGVTTRQVSTWFKGKRKRCWKEVNTRQLETPASTSQDVVCHGTPSDILAPNEVNMEDQ